MYKDASGAAAAAADAAGYNTIKSCARFVTVSGCNSAMKWEPVHER